ncbi:MORC family CW-type zinc finger protein 3 isoform X3 [Kryptolebias marmoratus]|uniref:MORC family CW-type zinc finger protein 3 isoform X3 n=1 Tax=Kryptolebias marmoratus TaxID=37003 RepID=UPI0007F8E90D|nr:MORC family CW-type zinc finger protein 3 isoform X3 [Kryptolebias marmoratus]
MASQSDRGVPLSTLSPKYLHSNSTSHTWPFSAIAELVDNAYDPDVKAKQLWIDMTEIKGEKCLSFMDNGSGLNYETMQKMLREEHKASLQDILSYSPFETQEELLAEVDAISSVCSRGKTGTRIIIWNLRRTSTGATEFDFETDPYDIRIPLEVCEELNDSSPHAKKATSDIPESKYSLRAYCTILYLKPLMQVVVRGQKVTSVFMAKTLAWTEKDHYKPTFLDKRIPITFGYNTKSKDQYGIMMYHKNRLIKAYERVGCQLKANNKGVGVIGIIECDFLEPTHNKQSFIENDMYRKIMHNLGIKLEEYWNEIRYRKSKENPSSTVPVEDTITRPDQTWVHCDDCMKWRKLPDEINVKRLPKKWFCSMNPDPQFRSCLVDEEAEDSDNEPSYIKTYKQEKEEKKKQENKIQQDKQDLRHLEKQELNAMDREMKTLEQQHKRILRQLNQKSPFSEMIQMNQPLQEVAVTAESPLPSSSSQAACSTSTTPGLPSSPSVKPQRGKRTQLVNSQNTPKRLRTSGFQERTSLSPNPVTMPMECSYNAAVDITSEETAAGSCPPKVVNSTTQAVALEQPECIQEKQILHNGVAQMESDETPGPSSLPQYPNITEVQHQQDQLLELTQDTAQERDSLKQEVQRLTVQLQDVQSRLQEQSLISVKEHAHQGCQTEDTESQKDFKSLIEKLHSVEEEKSNLAAQCEELRLSLQQQRENAQASQKDGKFSAQSHLEEAGGLTNSGTNSRSLIELRRNVGRLLITYVPALDLEQVNYECNVIDEILEQVLNEADTK